MTKKRNFGIRKLFAAAVTGVLVMQAAFVPVMADEEAIPDLGDIDIEALEEMPGLGSMTTDFEVTGTISAGELGDLELNVDGQIVADSDAKAQSLTGSFSTSGISYDFSEYFDGEAILLKIPGLPKVLSYNYHADPAGTFLGELVGADTLNAVNHILQLSYAEAADPEAMQQFGEELSAVFTDAMNQLAFEPAPEKECTIGGEAVTCQGLQAVISQDFVRELVDKLLGVSMPNGQTIQEYVDMLLALNVQDSTTSSTPASVSEAVESFLPQLPDLTFRMYMNEDGSMPVEFDLEAEDSTLALKLAGPAETPWSEIAITVDDQEVANLLIEMAADGVRVSLTAEGEEVCAFEFTYGESGATATLYVQGNELGTLVIDVTNGTFELSSAFLPSAITGTFAVDGDALTITADYEGLHISFSTKPGGTAVKPEGEVLELTEMTQEDFQVIGEALQSLTGGAVSQAADDAA